MNRILKKILPDYRSYLFLGIFLTILAPISEVFYWEKRSIFFAKWAFLFFAAATLKLLSDELIARYPKIIKIIKRSYPVLWKKLKSKFL